MTRTELYNWAMSQMREAARMRDVATGMLEVAAGTFDEAACAPSGSVDESDRCEGGREALQRMEPEMPVGRMAHGITVGG
jgi:hypothetical protein